MRFLRKDALALAGGLAAAAASLFPSPAHANCYEDVGCTDTDLFVAEDLAKLAECDILWEMRNGIYKEHGYCFHTPKAIEHFGNAGCLYDDAESVPLNAVERDNVVIIKGVEQQKGCND